MNFKKEDENYIYNIIGKNIKKYRKLKGWTQEKLANEINYSLSFISGIESNYHQTFSLGAIWRISQVLGVDFSKLCEDNDVKKSNKYILYKCNKCGIESKIPIDKLAGNNNPPQFDCTNCDGKLIIVNTMDI